MVLLFILIVVILFRQSSMHRIQETLINSKPSFNGSKGGDIPVKPSYAEEEEREEEREEEATKPAWRKIFPASRKVKQEEPTLSGLEPPVPVSYTHLIIDLGPEGGEKGGNVLATGTPEEIVKNRESHTARYLKEELDISR